MPLSISEASLRDAWKALAGATAFIVGLRALAVAVSWALSRRAGLHGGLVRSAEATLFLMCLVFFCVDSGLTLPVLLLSLAVALVIGWSLRSVRALFLGVFVVVSATASPLLSHGVVVTLDPRGTAQWQWASAFKGQRAVFPAVVGPCGQAVERRMSVYYDNVRLSEGRGAVAPTSCDTIQTSPPPPPSLASTRVDSEGTAATEEGEVTASAEEPLDDPPTTTTVAAPPGLLQVIISVGDRTRIDGLNGAAAATGPPLKGRVDAVALLGEGGALRHSVLSCGPGPCIAAAPHTRFENVTVLLPGGGTPPVVVARAESCAAMAAQLEAALGPAAAAAVLRCGSGAATSAAERFLKLLYHPDGSGSGGGYDLGGDAFLTDMPSLIAWRWYLPDYAHRARDAVDAVARTVALPAARAAVTLGRWLAGCLQALAVRVAAQARDAAPYLTVAGRHTQSGLLGLACGGDGGDGAWLPACADRRRRDAAFLAGAQLRDGVARATAAALDALEVVPGVWGLVRWSCRAEWAITAGIVRGAAAAITAAARGVTRAAGPAARGVAVLAEQLAVWAPLCVGPLQAAGRLAMRSSAGHTVGVGLAWVYREEMRQARWEAAAVHRLVLAGGGWAGQALTVAWQGLRLGVGGAGALLSLYMQSSFSIHIAVVFLQTMLLLIAVRNEVRELVEGERAVQARAAAAAAAGTSRGFGLDTLTQSVSRRLRGNAVLSRVSGVALFAKAHYYTCMGYVVTHLVLFVVLVGLSVLPFTGRLYSLTLHFALPWMSSEVFLTFFYKPAPARGQTVALWCGRLVATILLQRTVGNLLYRIVRDLLIAVGAFSAVVLCVWAWPRRGAIARTVTIAISESLNNTPMRPPRTPPPAPLLLSTVAVDGPRAEEGGDDVARRVVVEDAVTKEGEAVPAAAAAVAALSAPAPLCPPPPPLVAVTGEPRLGRTAAQPPSATPSDLGLDSAEDTTGSGTGDE